MATHSPAADTESVLEHHLEAFSRQDMDEMLADYDDDSVVVTNTMGTFHGVDEIRDLFETLFAEFSQSPVEFELDDQRIEADTAYIVWHAETPENSYEFATDTFRIRDGVIEVQTLGAVVSPKN
ncbi:nuclear transport factor 2 family protein [Halobaculum lipolyticum]|uniref:Nuclear transport factor 2 family protein n=1 Tax=Halobaculum lipolyticum TaxID=3032001 RepID=A0ABD5W8V3_9EURY|nr:nuclear transport factor 2 family protein [Halobaculum sp. DT31]